MKRIKKCTFQRSPQETQHLCGQHNMFPASYRFSSSAMK